MRNNMHRLICFFLALVLVMGLLPPTALTVSAEETAPEATDAGSGVSAELGLEAIENISSEESLLEYFKGKRVSILGDSISTYLKISNNTSYNTTIGDNRMYYSKAGKYDIWQKDTWWQQIIDMLGMELCVNNSWSSSAILTERAGTLGAYVDRCVQLHNDNTNVDPEVILVFMGTNDHSYAKKTWGSADAVNYDALYTKNADGTYTYMEPTTVCEAYAIMLHKMQIRYEGADIFCLGLMARRDPVYSGSDVGQPTTLNANMKKVVEKMGCVYVDLESQFTSDPDDFDKYIGDKRVHPNNFGMDKITKATLNAMLQDKNAACEIINDLTKVTSSNAANNLLLKGSSYETTLTKENGNKYMDVAVTMGGKDITKQCYADGKITIPEVTADVQISAISYGDADLYLDYRWEMNAEKTGLVNVTPDGYTANALTLETGSVTDGVTTDVRYALATPVTLSPNKPWVIEWKASGDWRGMLLSSAKSVANGIQYVYRNSSNNMLFVGNRSGDVYHNYGADTTKMDTKNMHVYRLENRVTTAEDGTVINKVYLVVDDVEIGVMNNYWQGSTNQNTTGDFPNGTELTFKYIGNSSNHLVSKLKLEYLEILVKGTAEHRHAYVMVSETPGSCVGEGYYTYTCSCGDSYTKPNGQVGETHTLSAWTVVEGQLRRECEHCDYFEMQPLSGYRWEMNAEGNAFVSVVDEYNTENTLELLKGSVSGGKFSGVQYKMAQKVELSHADEWVIEWKSTGDWSGVLLSTYETRTAGMSIVFRRNDLGMGVGTYKGSSFYNYGVNNNKVSSYMNGEHTFRLENRVTKAVDGTVSNMVYFIIDDIEISAMNNYFNATTDKETVENWVNGQNLSFQFFGMGTNHYVKGFAPEYMQIWLHGAEHKHAFVASEVSDSNCSSVGSTTYTCNCGETKVEAGTELGDHVYGEWQNENGELRRYCKFCGGYETDTINGYRWEYNSDVNSLVSVITGGNTQNDLRLMSGSITDGLFTNVIYKMANSVNLSHDKEWIIEWESSGDWNGMLLSSSTGNTDGMNFIFRKDTADLLALGTYVVDGGSKYHNYGIDTTTHFDVELNHVYRLENRVTTAEDGTTANMVYLVVDDIEIGAMNNFYVATTSQKTTVDWLNGQDLTFSYFGKSAGSHQLNNIKLSYLQILLNGASEHQHAYSIISTDEGTCVQEATKRGVCRCGHETFINTGVYGKHRHNKWTVVGENKQSACDLCGDVLTVRNGIHYDESVSGGYYTVISQKDYVLCDGVAESEVIINNANGTRRQVMHIVEVDVHNPNVEILPGYYGADKDLTDPNNWRATTLETTMDYYRDQLGYNVVAGMNTALTYNSSAPCSFMVFNGKVLATPGSIYNDNCDTYLAVIKNEDGTVSCELRSMSEPLKGNEWQAFSCNFGFTVKDGKVTASNPSRSGGSDRSMIGIKADGSLLIVEVEGRNSPYSLGLSGSAELGEAMLALGCVWAVNGDGGGSSQFLTKREGESDHVLRSVPSDGVPRATIMSVIIASKAKASGVFDHVSMLAEDKYVAPGGSTKVEVKGVDGAGMPAEIPADITYVATGGSYADGIFTSDGTLGEQVVTAYYKDQEVGSLEIQVVVPTSLTFDHAAMAVPYGETVEIAISAYYGTFKVALSSADVEFVLSEQIGTIDGLMFTAAAETAGAKNSADLTATLVYSRELTATIPVLIGKGSDVIYDFEDQDLHGWYRSTATNYNAIRVGGETYLVDSSNGHVHSGNYAMKVEMDFSNSTEGGYILATLVPGEHVILENAMTIGMWVYFTDEADSIMIDVEVPTYASKELPVVNSILTPDVGVADGGDALTADVGFVSAFDEPGWHYITVDVSSAKFVGLPKLKVYVCQKDGKNGYIYGEQPSTYGNYVFYVDDITVDYSQAVEDRESPIFEDLTFTAAGMDEAESLEGNVISGGAVSFSAAVADNMVKNNYSGLDAASAKVYIDGVEYTRNLTMSGLTDFVLSLDNVTLPAGMHSIKFSICDKNGNYASIIRKIIVGSADDAKVKVVAHDPDADRILTGSLYYIDVVADNPETISSVALTLDLNNISVWQLDHMDVANGFKASYSLTKDENIAKITITSDGETTLTGEDQILVSIPVRTWELPIVEPIKGHDGRVYMYHDYKAVDSVVPMDLNVETDAGYVTYKDGSGNSFVSPKILVMTELSGQAITDSGTAGMNYICNEPWYESWNGGHDHRPETKQYYPETDKDGKPITNHVDAVNLPDKAATCTESGYTGRTYCEVCKSVVDWGTTLAATGHTYDFVDGVLKCTCGKLFNGVHTDGKTYVDGVVSALNGWQGESYYVDGTVLTGIHKVPSPDDASVSYYYDFGTDGVCKNHMKYTGILQDGDVYRYSYIGTLTGGWQTIDDEWYYFSYQTLASVSGKQTIDGIEFEFEENGKLVSGVWVKDKNGLRYYYGPSYHTERWSEIDGKMYFFAGGYALTGKHCVEVPGHNKMLFRWYDFGEDGVAEPMGSGFITLEDGRILYLEDGYATPGLHKVGDDYYNCDGEGTLSVDGVHYAWQTNCDLPLGNYEFGADGKMLNGFVQKTDGMYYYIKGVPAPSGLTEIGDGIYFVGGYGKLEKGRLYAWATNCGLPCANYEFGEDYKMLHGIVEKADGMYYYIKGVPAPYGLHEVNKDYYFVSSYGKLETGTQYAWDTHCNLPTGSYEFGEDYKMVNPPVVEPEEPEVPEEPEIPEEPEVTVKNGIIKEDGVLRYYINDVMQNCGLFILDGDYYYANSKYIVVTGIYYVWTTNDLLPQGNYEFGADGKMLNAPGAEPEEPEIPTEPEVPEEPEVTVKNGIIKEDGVLRYYINDVMQNCGLFILDGDYYYANSKYIVVTGIYYVWTTNDLLPQGNYEFGADGKMLNAPGAEPEEPTEPEPTEPEPTEPEPTEPEPTEPETPVKNGIIEEDGVLRYYIDDVMQNCGLFILDGEYYYVNSKYIVVTGTYYVWTTNDLLPQGSYEFGADGKMLDGFVQKTDGLYYYIDGMPALHGLHEIEGDYYFVSSYGKLETGIQYAWDTHCNLPTGSYEFGEDYKMLNAPGAEPEEPTEPEPTEPEPTEPEPTEPEPTEPEPTEPEPTEPEPTEPEPTEPEPTEPETPTEPEPTEPEVPEEPEVTVKNGIIKEDGVLRYYINDVMQNCGLFILDGDYYYANSKYIVVTGIYYVWTTNDLLPQGNYEFGEDGKMLNPPSQEPEEPEVVVKNGIIEEDGVLHYYIDGVMQNCGLFILDGDYYYANSKYIVVTGTYYVWTTNDLLPQGNYEFGEDGKMLNPPVEEPEHTLTYEEYSKLSAEEQTAYRDTFESLAEFMEWYNAAKAEYEANNPGIDVGDGSLDLDDLA